MPFCHLASNVKALKETFQQVTKRILRF